MEQFGSEEAETEVNLDRFHVTAVASLGNGVALSFGRFAAVTFLTEFTLHGPVRVAVRLDLDGKVKDAKVMELTEETFPWIKPLLNQNFTHDYIGRDSEANFTLGEHFARVHLESMPHFYGQIVASLIQRAVLLFDVAVMKRGEKL